MRLIILIFEISISLALIISGINCQTTSTSSTTTTRNNAVLINYWPMNNLSDIVGGANLYGGANYSFTTDRFCSPNSAIYFNSSSYLLSGSYYRNTTAYLQVPSGVYFSGDFTVTAWIYLISYQYYETIFDFTINNGSVTDNVNLKLQHDYKIFGTIRNGTNGSFLTTGLIINFNQWYFVSFVLSGTTGYIYVNGNQAVTGTMFIPNNMMRTKNNIGQYANAIYDEIKIYQGAFSATQIMYQYQNSSNNGKYS